MRSLSLKPHFRFKSHLDPPWTGALDPAIKTTSLLILLNTTLILLLGIISAASTNLSSMDAKADSTYIQSHTMLLYAELIFFYLTIPLVYVATNVIENWCLWEDRLRPLYVIAAAVIAVNIWILQLTVWGPCMFAEGEGPGYCPYLFRDPRVELGTLQGTGTPKMVFFGMPSLFLLYIAYLALGIIAYRRERKRPSKTESFELSKAQTFSPRSSEVESFPFRNSWTSRSSPPKASPDRESYLSPKTRKPGGDDEDDDDGEATPSLRNEPAIALMLTTPHGTTEAQDPFDDDRLSRLGFKTH